MLRSGSSLGGEIAAPTAPVTSAFRRSGAPSYNALKDGRDKLVVRSPEKAALSHYFPTDPVADLLFY
jgi:hypothetical protein